MNWKQCSLFSFPPLSPFSPELSANHDSVDSNYFILPTWLPHSHAQQWTLKESFSFVGIDKELVTPKSKSHNQPRTIITIIPLEKKILWSLIISPFPFFIHHKLMTFFSALLPSSISLLLKKHKKEKNTLFLVFLKNGCFQYYQRRRIYDMLVHIVLDLFTACKLNPLFISSLSLIFI